MLNLCHESFEFGAPRSEPRKATGLGKANPGSMERNKDRCLIAGFGGPASGTGKRFVWTESHDSGTMDTWHKSGGNPGPNTRSSSRPSDPIDGSSEATTKATFGKASPGVWPAKGCLGWTNAGGSPEEAFWTEAESATGAILAA